MRTFLFLLVVIVSGCAGVPSSYEFDSPEAAKLSFVRSGIDADFDHSFASIDGRHLKGAPHTLSVKPGTRTIGYYCQLFLDGPPPPTLTMDFESGRAYEFHCADGAEAAVHEK